MGSVRNHQFVKTNCAIDRFYKGIMNFIHQIIFDKGYQVSSLAWQRLLEQPRIMKSILSKMILIILDGLNKESCIAAYLFSKKVLKLVRGSGLLFTALYLKQCNSSLQVAYGGVKAPHALLPTPLSLNRSGYPTIIPAHHRKDMRRHDDKADQLVQLYLSFFTLYRVIKLAKKVSLSNTFKTIVEPTDLDAVSSWCEELKQSLHTLTERYLPLISTIPLNQGMTWEPTWKSLPTTRWVNKVFQTALKELGIRRLVSCFPALPYEVDAFTLLRESSQQLESMLSQTILWPPMTRYALDDNNDLLTDLCYDLSEKLFNPFPMFHEPSRRVPIMGRLGQSVEGGGKRRIFAIGNYVNQRLLKPVHQWLMEVLRPLPTDGTFNQEKPLDNLVGEMVCFSFDLRAATDRWPLQILFEVMFHLFGNKFAGAVRTALAYNIFEIPFVKRRHAALSFIAGQPLGYYSSWPLFTLSHHYLVWWCAEKVYPGKHFTRYGILGDDVVIADSNVAAEYERTLGRIKVGISYQKSLISTSGAAEFAKRLRIRALSKDISPISARALCDFFTPFGLLTIGLKYHCQRVTTLARVGGKGYRSLADPKRLRLLRVMQLRYLLGKGHYELWLGRGRLLDPHVRAAIIRKLVKQLRPSDLKLPPESLFEKPGIFEFLEYTMLRSWMDQWNHYLLWYSKVALDPWVKLDDLFEGPICQVNWRLDRKDIKLIRFSLLWTLHDEVLDMSESSKIPILEAPSAYSLCGWLFGGVSGSSFLIQARGLVQPRARSGVVLPGVVVNDYAYKDPRKTPIHYKTLGVPDRQSLVDFVRPSKRSRTEKGDSAFGK
jgi:hypothetical protein